MPEEDAEQAASAEVTPALEGGTYEIIRQRLLNQASDLKTKVGQLDELRKSVFGSVPLALKKSGTHHYRAQLYPKGYDQGRWQHIHIRVQCSIRPEDIGSNQ